MWEGCESHRRTPRSDRSLWKIGAAGLSSAMTTRASSIVWPPVPVESEVSLGDRGGWTGRGPLRGTRSGRSRSHRRATHARRVWRGIWVVVAISSSARRGIRCSLCCRRLSLTERHRWALLQAASLSRLTVSIEGVGARTLARIEHAQLTCWECHPTTSPTKKLGPTGASRLPLPSTTQNDLAKVRRLWPSRVSRSFSVVVAEDIRELLSGWQGQ